MLILCFEGEGTVRTGSLVYFVARRFGIFIAKVETLLASGHKHLTARDHLSLKTQSLTTVGRFLVPGDEVVLTLKAVWCLVLSHGPTITESHLL